jgi:hypothetical protein
MLSPPRVSQKDYIQVEDVFLVPIYISLSKEAARDAEVVGEADAVVDGDRPRARLDVDGAAPSWLRRAHGLFSGEVPLLRLPRRARGDAGLGGVGMAVDFGR